MSSNHVDRPLQPHVNQAKLDEYAIKIKDFCLTNGLILLSKSGSQPNKHDASSPIPVTLLPTSFPREEFQFVADLQPHFQELILSVSQDFQFLKDTLKDVIKVDDFTRRLWNICEIVNSEGISQPITLAILRNDYMIDLNKRNKGLPTCLSQIELNTISCSFGAATSKIAQLHNHSLRFTENSNLLQQHAKNENASQLANGLIKAWKLYGNPKAKLVFLVSINEANIGDQRLLEYKCLELEPNLDIRRYSITDFVNFGTLDAQKNLIIEGNEVALVYFRSCYDPSDFLSDKEWDARLLIERSRAIKCPCIQVHLTGAKIIQQALSQPNALSRFVKDQALADRMRATFVDIYSIRDENLNEILSLINEKSEEFVLKPQREGGGHNIYKEDIKKFVAETPNKEDLKGFILMKLVRASISQNYIVRAAREVKLEDVINEVGIFGYYIANASTLIENQTTGYLLRTKLFGVNEGGVAAGFSALDSILLS